MKYKVVCQRWEESERGWGVRPDGYSLHLTESDRQTFVKAYWDRMPDNVPDEYLRPSGNPYWCLIDSETYDKIKDPVSGIWVYGLRGRTSPTPA